MLSPGEHCVRSASSYACIPSDDPVSRLNCPSLRPSPHCALARRERSRTAALQPPCSRTDPEGVKIDPTSRHLDARALLLQLTEATTLSAGECSLRGVATMSDLDVDTRRKFERIAPARHPAASPVAGNDMPNVPGPEYPCGACEEGTVRRAAWSRTFRLNSSPSKQRHLLKAFACSRTWKPLCQASPACLHFCGFMITTKI